MTANQAAILEALAQMGSVSGGELYEIEIVDREQLNPTLQGLRHAGLIAIEDTYGGWELTEAGRAQRDLVAEIPEVKQPSGGRETPAQKTRTHIVRWREALANGELDSTAKAVGHAVALYAKSYGGWVWASETSLGRLSSFSEKTVREALRRLEAAGLVERELRSGRTTRVKPTLPARQPR